MPILIQPAELAARLEAEARGARVPDGSAPRTVVLDVRWTLAKPDGRDDFRAGHIPGAIHVDMDTELADHDAIGEGRHPLPSEQAFTRAMRRWGLRDDDTVVVADGGGSFAAARAWWLLEHAGWPDVRILDGAFPGWRAAGLPVETGDTTPEPGDATARFGSLPVVDLDEADALGASPNGV
ncbi:MAG TPA: rhodanese-like domain-containing protein, partial [Agromyces sp.]|nr:rhodanese-like domain-containing protein [Agromyces sp.]